MAFHTKLVLFIALVLVIGQLVPTVHCLKRKNRNPGGGKLSLFNPFIVLDEEDQKDLGKAGLRYAQNNHIVSRNPILLIPGMAPISAF
jgi:hypothetical protein